jgi:hypothetical protein
VTTRTRRWIVIAVVVLGLALPLETVLLQAIATPDSQTAVRNYVAGLDADALQRAADRIQDYPLTYRREIMRALTPEWRAAIWRRHIQTYLASHPSLRSDAVPVLETLSLLATPAMFDAPSDADRKQVQLLAEQVKSLMGKDEAEYLLYRLGRKDGTFASAEPLSMRVADYVRGVMVAMARAEDCECSTDFGCDAGSDCRGGTGCTVDNEWPACGWFWNSDCDGICRAGRTY